MGKMNVVLPDDVEERFRRAVFEKKGMKKGNISEVPERSPAQQSNDCSVQKSAEESTEYVYSYHCSYYIIVTTL